MYKVGDKIYYTGDQANIEGFGEIVLVNSVYGGLYDIQLEDGRLIRKIGHYMFDRSPGRRFWLLSEWEADRKEKIAALYRRMEAV